MSEEAPKLRSVDSPEPTKPRGPTSPSFLGTLEELQGGTLPAILTRVLADTAMAVAEHAAGRDFDGRRIKSLERRLARLERRIGARHG